MSPVRVLYIGNFDPFEAGGTRRAYEVVRRVHQYGVEPYILHVKKVPDDPLTKVGALRSLKEVSVVLKSIEEARRLSVDLIVATSESPSPVMLAHRIAEKLGRPWTAVMQLPIILRYTPASTEPIVIDPLWLPQQVYALNMLRKTVVLTVSISCIMESSAKIPRYIVLRPGVGIDLEKYLSANEQEKLYDAIFMARLTPEKGVYDVVKIWGNIVKEYPSAKLAVAGRFKSYRVAVTFFNLVRKYGLEKNIFYLGFLTEKKKVLALKSARLFIYPSRLDSFPIVVLEALAAGLPVIAYDIPAIRYNYPADLVIRVPRGGINALVERVLEFLADGNWVNVGSRARMFAKLFTWERATEAEIRAYEKIL